MTTLFDKRTQNLLVDIDVIALAAAGRLFRANYDPDSMGAVAYDLRAGGSLASRNRARTFLLTSDTEYVIEPGELVTVETLEDLDFSEPLLAGLILSNHTQLSAGLYHPTTSVDAGFQGRLSISLTNLGNSGCPIRLGSRIAKLLFVPVSPTPRRLYGTGQSPRVRQGSIDHALIFDRRASLAGSDLESFLGGPVGDIARRLSQVEEALVVHSDRQALRGYQKVATALGVVFLGAAGSIIATYWGDIVRWLRGLLQ